jgi:hypothetical protein
MRWSISVYGYANCEGRTSLNRGAELLSVGVTKWAMPMIYDTEPLHPHWTIAHFTTAHTPTAHLGPKEPQRLSCP